jgi:hypothetical protein
MSKNKSRYTDKEYSLIQKQRYEIEKLKRENKRLTKQLNKYDLNHHVELHDILEESYEKEEQITREQLEENLKEKWRCFECKEGSLKIVIINRIDGLYYFRKCENCPKRTKLKKYNENIKK